MKNAYTLFYIRFDGSQVISKRSFDTRLARYNLIIISTIPVGISLLSGARHKFVFDIKIRAARILSPRLEINEKLIYFIRRIGNLLQRFWSLVALNVHINLRENSSRRLKNGFVRFRYMSNIIVMIIFVHAGT